MPVEHPERLSTYVSVDEVVVLYLALLVGILETLLFRAADEDLGYDFGVSLDGVDSLEGPLGFDGSEGLEGVGVLGPGVDLDAVVCEDVSLPQLEPLEVDYVADVLQLLLTVDLVPGLEVLDQLLLQLHLHEDVEELPVLLEVEDLPRLLLPLLHTHELLALRNQHPRDILRVVEVHLVVHRRLPDEVGVGLHQDRKLVLVQPLRQALVKYHEHQQANRLDWRLVAHCHRGIEISPL